MLFPAFKSSNLLHCEMAVLSIEMWSMLALTGC